MQDNNYDIIILGSGPSGLTSAIYSSRANLKTLVISGDTPGGQLTQTTDIENFPGFPQGIMGSELMMNMRSQAERFEASFVDKNAKEVKGTLESGFTVTTIDGSEYTAKAVIIATGASAKWLGLENEQRLIGRGVSACATCDGFFFKDKIVAVVGGGDVSMEDTNVLTKFCEKVYVIVRGSKEKLRASKIMQERTMNNPKVEFLFNTEVQDVLGENSVEGLKLINNVTNETSELEVDGLFIAIGHRPNTDFIKNFVEIDEKGYISVEDNTRTSVEGVFVAGDVQDFRYRQAITAAGLGCMAALDAARLLEDKGLVESSGSSW